MMLQQLFALQQRALLKCHYKQLYVCFPLYCHHLLPSVDKYCKLTLCVSPRAQVHHKSLSLGEVLDGDRMAESLYYIQFRENVEKRTLCQLVLSEKQVIIFILFLTKAAQLVIFQLKLQHKSW